MSDQWIEVSIDTTDAEALGVALAWPVRLTVLAPAEIRGEATTEPRGRDASASRLFIQKPTREDAAGGERRRGCSPLGAGRDWRESTALCPVKAPKVSPLSFPLQKRWWE